MALKGRSSTLPSHPLRLCVHSAVAAAPAVGMTGTAALVAWMGVFLSPRWGLQIINSATHSLRCGLHSCAALRLGAGFRGRSLNISSTALRLGLLTLHIYAAMAGCLYTPICSSIPS